MPSLFLINITYIVLLGCIIETVTHIDNSSIGCLLDDTAVWICRGRGVYSYKYGRNCCHMCLCVKFLSSHILILSSHLFFFFFFVSTKYFNSDIFTLSCVTVDILYLIKGSSKAVIFVAEKVSESWWEKSTNERLIDRKFDMSAESTFRMSWFCICSAFWTVRPQLGKCIWSH